MNKHAKSPYAALLMLAMAVVCAVSGCSEPPATQTPVADTRTSTKPDMGGVESIVVETEGRGPTVMNAVANALQLAVAQVNGTAVDALSTSIESGLSLSDGNETVQLHASAFQEAIRTRTKGMVTNFKLLKKEQDDQVWTVTVEAQIAKYKRSESANRVRVAVAMPRIAARTTQIDGQQSSGAEVAQQLRQGLVDALTNSNRFTVLDREFDAELDEELGRLQSGNVAQEDMARLEQELATDLLWVGTLERFEYLRHSKSMRTRDTEIYWFDGGAELSYRLVNVATKQVMYSGSARITLPESEPTTRPDPMLVENMVKKMREALLGQISHRIIQQMFPVTIVSKNGNSVILSQGDGQIEAGTRYRVVHLGDELKDPQTGQSLGRAETRCCDVLISRVTASTAYGELENISIKVEDQFVPGSLVMREMISMPDVVATLPTAQAPAVATVATADEAEIELEAKPITTSAATKQSQSTTTSKVEATPSTDKDW